jgi:hypothetical protein
VKARRWTLTLFAAVGLILIGVAWLVRDNNFALAVLLNLGTGALIVVAVSLVAFYLDGRIETTSQELRAFIRTWRQSTGLLPRSRTPIKDAAEHAVNKMNDQESERFNLLEEKPRADRLARLLFQGYLERWLYFKVSVPLDDDFRLEFSTDDNGRSVSIKVVGRSEESRIAALRATSGFQLSWHQVTRYNKTKFSDIIASIAKGLPRIGYSNYEAIRNSDQTWRRLVQTLRIAFGFRAAKLQIIEIPNADWAITGRPRVGSMIGGIVSMSDGTTTFNVEAIWDDTLVTEQSEASEQGDSFIEAVELAREIFWSYH